MNKLGGKVAVITGGSSGIGLETAKRFVGEGAKVFVTGRREEELSKAAAMIGGDVVAVRGDVQAIDDLDALFERIRKEAGRIDVLFANAGFIAPQNLDELTTDNLDKTVSINLRGAILTVQKALPLIADGGSIIVTSSIAAVKGIAGYGVYSATKAAVRSLVRTWTVELKPRGIRVNAISPGPIDTPIIDGQAADKAGADKIRAAFADIMPLGRMGRPEEVAAVALFLASEDSSFVAGADLVVDGGMSAI